MARNINIMVSSENDDTTRDGVPDWLIHFDVSWLDNDGVFHQDQRSEYFLLLINWLRTNHPAEAKQLMETLAVAIARRQVGLDERLRL